MRARFLFTAALLAGSAPLLAAETPISQEQRELQNRDVLLSQYPARARAAGEQGAVHFRVNLDRSGHPTACEVTQSSGHSRLDQETCDLIVTRAVFKPVKDADGDRVASAHEGVINWTIPGSTAPIKAPVTVKKASATGKLICKRSAATGSLVSRERTCMTRRQWDQASTESRQPWEEIQGKGYTNGN